MSKGKGGTLGRCGKVQRPYRTKIFDWTTYHNNQTIRGNCRSVASRTKDEWNVAILTQLLDLLT
jgi:hypothetical protein